MNGFIVQFLVAGGVMGILDAVWLSAVANRFYKSQIGSLLRSKPNMKAAIAFYVVYVVGVVVFVISPALANNSWQYALTYGALLGLVSYATYDLTNLSTLKGFTTKLVVVDLIWGVCLTSVVSVVSFSVVNQWFS